MLAPVACPPSATRSSSKRTAFASLVLLVVLAACSSTSSSGDCSSTDSASSCSGTFACGNSGIEIACDAATQVCVVQPGMVFCETIAGASATHCPSATEAASTAGCTTPFTPSCSGSSGSGITVTCKN